MVSIFRSSEFWVGLVAAILQFLVTQHVLSPSVAEFVNMAIVYVVGRLLGKVAKATLKPSGGAVGVIFLLAGLSVLPSLARAAATEEVPLLSAKRASVAAGLNYAWRTTPLADNSDPLLGRHAEWEAGVFGAYNLISPSAAHPQVPHISLVGSTTLGVDSRQFRHTVGIRWRFWSGKAAPEPAVQP